MPFILVLCQLKFPHISKTNFQNGSTNLWGNFSKYFSLKLPKWGLRPAFIVLFNQIQDCFLDRILRKFFFALQTYPLAGQICIKLGVKCYTSVQFSTNFSCTLFCNWYVVHRVSTTIPEFWIYQFLTQFCFIHFCR